MNSKSVIDEASSGSEASSSNNNSIPNNNGEGQSQPVLCINPVSGNTQDTMKRAAKQLIERYFYQLLDGCGNPNCNNQYCASSQQARNLTANEAAAEAIKLAEHKEAWLCDRRPNKVPRTEPSNCDSNSSTCNTSDINLMTNSSNVELSQNKKAVCENNHLMCEGVCIDDENFKYKNVPLTEELVRQLSDDCLQSKSPLALINRLRVAIVHPEILAKSFQGKVKNYRENSEEDVKTDKESKAMCSTSDPDKDIDSVTGPAFDAASCHRAFRYLAKVPPHYYSAPIVRAVASLAIQLKHELMIHKRMNIDDVVNCFVIAFEIPDLGNSSEYMDVVLPTLCIAIEYLPIKARARLARIWAEHCKDSLRQILESLHQLITLRVISTNYTRKFQVQDDQYVTLATRLMRTVYYANILAGEMEQNPQKEEHVTIPSQFNTLNDALHQLLPLATMKIAKQIDTEDSLAAELGINVLDARKPYLPFEEFYNEPLNDNIEMDTDFAHYKSELSSGSTFSFLNYPFILTAATKSLGLYYENRIRMYTERRVSLLHAVVGATPPIPFLRLKVRRTHIIEDALVELEIIAMERTTDLKKQLVVEFEGEQGVDEGGVSKEFFQLIVEEIFNPDYGMFTQQPDSHTVWFNPTSFETEGQFTLIGIVVGLAIYNNVILAVSFPMVVYRKLMGRKGSFNDLADWNPFLYKGLKDMLDYEDNDLEEVYCQTFRICYQDVYGNNIFHDLKEDGDNVFVTQDNKKEFVETYADFLLNKSVETQFKAFRRGFVMVTDESPLDSLFRPEEIETLICGSKNFDFNELEKSTEYDGGFTTESQIIKDFWSIVHGLSMEDKRKLLQFTTGSDRVPVGGLSHLKLVIARNGADTERLPTAHTCFNVLLLPEYDSKEKLEDRLMKAISYSKGFGML